MRKYLFYGSYTTEGYNGLIKDGGSSRIEAAKKALKSAGGSLESFYFATNNADFYIIVNLPDDVSATAILLAGNISGTFNIKSVPLLTPEQMDEAVQKHVDFRPPGK